MIIAITGVPASGKTTLAKELAAKLNFTYLNIHDFAKKNDAIENFDSERQCDVINVAKLPEIQNSTVIDGHFSHDLPNLDKCIFCTCNRKILVKRMKKRGYSDDKIQENLDVVNFRVLEDEVDDIDTPILAVSCTNSYKPDIDSILDWLNE